MLASKSLIELRGIAQSFGVSDIFQKDRVQLMQAIEQHQKSLSVAQDLRMQVPAYDARLMTKNPSKKSTRNEVEQLLAPLVQKGMHLSFDDERWYIKHGKKTDEGTLRMPLRHIMNCANRLMA